jgi:hypothetical protein
MPRPPQCCCYNGCEVCMANPGDAAWEMPADTNCPNRMTLSSTNISPEAAAAFMPVGCERLGKLPNELNVVGPIGAPATGRTTAPAR